MFYSIKYKECVFNNLRVYKISTKSDFSNLQTLTDNDVLICSDAKYKSLYEKYR